MTDDRGSAGLGGRFPTTRFSALVGARASDAERKRSLEALIAAYWKPVYKHVRMRWRASNEDAKDLTQAFFEHAASHDFFASFDPTRARFRTFIRHCLDGFVINARKAEQRLKRGGGTAHVSFDFDDVEAELEKSQQTAQDLETIFDQEWYRCLLGAAVAALYEHCARTNKQEHFALFERYDLSDAEPRPTYEALGKELGIPTTTVTNRLSYARRELRRFAIEALREITATDEELESETRLLFGAPPR